MKRTKAKCTILYEKIYDYTVQNSFEMHIIDWSARDIGLRLVLKYPKPCFKEIILVLFLRKEEKIIFKLGVDSRIKI